MLNKLKQEILQKKMDILIETITTRYKMGKLELFFTILLSFLISLIIFAYSNIHIATTTFILIPFIINSILCYLLTFNEKKIIDKGYTFLDDIIKKLQFNSELIEYDITANFYNLSGTFKELIFTKDNIHIYRGSYRSFHLNNDGKTIDHETNKDCFYLTVPQSVLFDIDIQGQFKHEIIKPNLEFLEGKTIYLLNTSDFWNLLKSKETLTIKTPYQELEISKELKEILCK